jgi:hypothetical protein
MALAFTFVLVPTQVHADLVTYTLTGTIQDVVGYSDMYGHVNPGASLPVAKGDRIAWTVQYDRSTPAKNFPLGVALAPGITSFHDSSYSPSGPLITHLVDQTNGFHLYTAPAGSIPAGSYSPSGTSNFASLLSLTNFLRYGSPEGSISLLDFQQSTQKGATPYLSDLQLTSNQLLPTLANLQLDQVPFRLNDPSIPAAQQFSYKGQLPNTTTYFSFDAQVNSLSAAVSIASLPEPGALTLFALGIVGLAVRHIRRAPDAA